MRLPLSVEFIDYHMAGDNVKIWKHYEVLQYLVQYQ